MAYQTGYDTKWPIGGDREFEIRVGVNLDDYEGYALHLVYADLPKAGIIDKYTLNTETDYKEKLVTKSAAVGGSTITMMGQRETSELFKNGARIDCILFLQKDDADYVDSRKMEQQDPIPFCTAAKGSTSLPDVS